MENLISFFPSSLFLKLFVILCVNLCVLCVKMELRDLRTDDGCDIVVEIMKGKRYAKCV